MRPSLSWPKPGPPSSSSRNSAHRPRSLTWSWRGLTSAFSLGSRERTAPGNTRSSGSISFWQNSATQSSCSWNSELGAAEDLVDEAQLELAEAGAAQLLVEEQRPQAPLLDLVLEGLDQRLQLGVAGADGAREHQVERLDLVLAELGHPVELLLEL